jgi:hypothetical protein
MLNPAEVAGMLSRRLRALVEFDETETDPRCKLSREDVEFIHDEAARRADEAGDPVAQEVLARVANILRPRNRIVLELRVKR